MTPTVFYSWQSDLPRETNSVFIRSCLGNALEQMEIDEPLRGEGEAGTPDIPSVIFRKLTQATAAVFDITPVGSTNGGKAVLNPNVAIELGYAAHAIGWSRILCVFNKAYGSLPEGLPFDLRHRRFPVTYDSSKDLNDEREKLTAKLKEYVKIALDHPHREAVHTRKRLTEGCVTLIDGFGKNGGFHYSDSALKPDIERLLDLGVIELDVNPAAGKYAYHWTRLGSIICEWYQKELAGNPAIQKALSDFEEGDQPAA